MSINTENYTDAKGAQAHLGFMLLLVLDFISKDSLTYYQTIATIFIAVAIPLFLVSLMLLPGERKISKWQLRVSFVTLNLAHLSGLISIVLIFWGFSKNSGVYLLVSSAVAYTIFSAICYKSLGENFLEEIEKQICEDEKS